MSNWWWLSFCDRGLPKGRQFLGVAVVEAEDFREAVEVSIDLRCNPGGEVMGCQLLGQPPDNFCNRLLRKAEAEQIGGELAST